MLSKKAGSKAREELGILAATVLCLKQGCEAEGPEAAIGPAVFKLYEGRQAKAGERKRGQISLLDLTRSSRKERAEQEGAGRLKAGTTLTLTTTQVAEQEEAGRRPAEAGRGQKRAEGRGRAESAGPAQAAEAPRPPPPPPLEAAERAVKEVGEAASLEQLLEPAARALGVDPGRARQILAAALGYLSTYPSVGILRFVEDVSKISKAGPDLVKKLLMMLRSAEVVEVHEMGVVNLKRAVNIKRETRL